MKIQNSDFLSIGQLQDNYLKQNVKINEKIENGLSFQDILNKKSLSGQHTSNVKFSKHATSRLSERNIELSKKQIERLNEGTKKAGDKGIKESLVIVDSLAFVVNVPNNTVITAMDQIGIQDNVFTNIDGAVVI